MTKLFNYIVFLVLAIGLSSFYPVYSEENNPSEEEKEQEKGPEGGKIFRNGDFAVEVKIVEKNSPPKFNVYAYNNDSLVDPKNVDLKIELTRIDGEVNRFTFAPEKNHLVGDGIVEEPHSFDVLMEATFEGKSHKWEYESYEGRTTISNEAAREAKIGTEKVGPATINEYANLTGKIIPSRNTTAQVRARFPGIVKSIEAMWGQRVRKGDILARIEANESLKVYNVTAPVDGIILERNTNIGDVPRDAPLFTIADLSEVWAEFHIFPSDLPRITEGQAAKVYSVGGENPKVSNASIKMLLPTVDVKTQTVRAIVPIDNKDGFWRPGMIVKGDVLVAEKEVALAVKTSGLQSFIDFTVVFAKFGDTYEVRMLDLGLNDGEMVEVLGGIKPGTEYVSQNSFLIKADVEKSGASHDH